MKNYTNDSNHSLESSREHQSTGKETVETIQNVSKNIKDYSLKMRETMKTLRESGVIPEMAEAIREGSLAVCDTIKDINSATKELKKNGVIVDTARAVENTLKSAEDSLTLVREIASDAEKASPRATKTMQEGIDFVKQETSQVTEKVVKGVKNKVGEGV